MNPGERTGDGMSRRNDAAPVIIKRKKVVGGHGHHGGAWKVAFADFATAMMAFFLMMWLLGATDESQRRGLADYFSPTTTVHRISAGGDNILGGTDVRTPEQMGISLPSGEASEDDAARLEQDLEAIREQLDALGGESPAIQQALRHVMTQVTDKGLVIEIFDLPGAPLFETDSDSPEPVLWLLAGLLHEALRITANPVSIEGHVRSYSVVELIDPRWSLSAARAERFREILETSGFDPRRVDRITGHADRRQAQPNPMAIRNNRLELILLRQNRP